MKLRLGLVAIGLLAGCGAEAPRGGLSPEEERRLENIAKMLDEGPGNLSFELPDEGNASGSAAGNRQ